MSFIEASEWLYIMNFRNLLYILDCLFLRQIYQKSLHFNLVYNW